MSELNLWLEHVKWTPLGTQTNSKAPNKYVEGVYPRLAESGTGCKLTAANGREYIDYIAGLGCISLGYNNEYVNNSVIQQLKKGVSFSLPTLLESQVSQALCQRVPSTDMWKFTKTGSDADSMAIKAARAYTKRNKIMVLGYHGWHDWYSIVNDKKLGIPGAMADNVIKARYDKSEDVKRLEQFDIAAVIMEPMVFDRPSTGYLDYLRHMCSKTGTLLIWDEVVTGGRFENFVAQNYFGIRPDLTVLSKGIANGFPLAAIGGPKAFMSVFEHDDFFASTTFGGECIGLAACLATLEEIDRTITQTVANGELIERAFNTMFEGDAICKGYPTRTTFDFPTKTHKALFWQECAKDGVLFGYSNFIMAAHGLDEVSYTLGVMEKAAHFLKKNWKEPIWKLEGRLPVEPLRMRT